MLMAYLLSFQARLRADIATWQMYDGGFINL
jgi:hypothetical protein